MSEHSARHTDLAQDVWCYKERLSNKETQSQKMTNTENQQLLPYDLLK